MSAFTDLEAVDPDPVVYPGGERVPNRFTIRELGTRMKALTTYIDTEVDPLLERLKVGLLKMKETPFSTEGDLEHRRLAHHWLALRAKMRDLLPPCYALAIRVRALYLKLDEDGKHEAETLYGPLQDRSRDKHDASVLMKELWPGDILKRYDEIARTEGIALAGDATPWQKTVPIYRKGRRD